MPDPVDAFMSPFNPRIDAYRRRVDADRIVSFASFGRLVDEVLYSEGAVDVELNCVTASSVSVGIGPVGSVYSSKIS